MATELNKYILDIVYAEDGGCRMRSYSIAASSAESAFERFQNEETEEFPVVYEGEVVPAIIVGIVQN